LFDESDDEFWQTGLLIKVSIRDKLQIDYIPIVKAINSVRLADGKTAEDILVAMHQRSCEILKSGFVEQQYRQIAADSHLHYVIQFGAFGKWLCRIDRRLLNGTLAKRKYNKEQLLAIQNSIQCEAHRELVLAGLQGDK
jgi:poly-gamma-glutamate synthesis protein (capsule biosynthesis protein)